MMTDDVDSMFQELANEMRNDAEIGAWNTPEKALEHYARRLESYKQGDER
jgi:hypothetical protein